MCSFLCLGVRHSRCIGSVRTWSEISFFLTNTGIYNKSWNTYLKGKCHKNIQKKEVLQWRMWLGGYPHNLMCMLMRVCGWVHARVCILFCVLQNPQTFLLSHYKITRSDSSVPWTSSLSNVQEIFFGKSCSVLLEALDIPQKW